MATIDQLGADVPWRVRRLCLWQLEFVAEINDVPVNLTGYTISARITASRTSSTALKTPTTTITNAAAGQFKISLAEASADLAAGTYWWALEWDGGSGDIPLCSGALIVEPWVVV
jgi:hypothetical protein